MKRLAVVASGWHFPIAFFEQMKGQKVPEGWQVDMCVSHRDPLMRVRKKRKCSPGSGSQAGTITGFVQVCRVGCGHRGAGLAVCAGAELRQ